MKNALALTLFAFLAIGAAQQTPADTNPLDLTKFKDIAAATSLPTVMSVKNARAKAEELFNSDKCNADALAEWAKQANWLSNLMVSGLQPFYSASSADRKSVSGNTLDVLSPIETAANTYKKERNLATVMRAECLVKTKKLNEAAAVYGRALDLISVNEMELWSRATTGLYNLIGVTPPKF